MRGFDRGTTQTMLRSNCGAQTGRETRVSMHTHSEEVTVGTPRHSDVLAGRSSWVNRGCDLVLGNKC